MKKGIIVVEIPESCRVCGLPTASGYCLAAKKDVFLYGAKNEKPEWCPIRELPKKKEPTRMPFSPMVPWQYTEYEKGWNDCLKAIDQEN